MAITMSSSWDFTSTVKFRQVSRSSAWCNQHLKYAKPSSKSMKFADIPSLLFSGLRSSTRDVRWFMIPLATESSKAAAEPNMQGSINSEMPDSNDQPSSSNVQPDQSVGEQTSPEMKKSMPKRPPLTAREKLRAARVLSRYTEAKPSKQPMGSKVLEMLRESDKGKRKSGLPEAPTNLFDDSNRGLPKQGWTFEFPGGSDVLVVVFSFVLISTIMFATTFIVWKAGAIHFNEY